MTEAPPLEGVLVADLTRMLPGAVLVRALVDLGARVVKVEDPNGGDLLRTADPLVEGVGAGFAAFFPGVESVALDLKSERGAAAVRALAARADVLVESFRPGTLERFGLAPEELASRNPRLVLCSMPGFSSRSSNAGRAVHDLNVAAVCGFLEGLPDGALPRIQLADVSTGLLALSSILAALFARERTGKGARLEQPLATGPLPFQTWTLAAASAGGEPLGGRLRSGEAKDYRRYRCADGVEVAVAALEPKLKRSLLEMVGAQTNFEAAPLEAIFLSRPSGEWLRRARESGLPVTRVNDAASALEDEDLSPLLAGVPGTPLLAPGPFLPSFPRRAVAPAPALGAHTAAVLSELGLGEP